MFVPWNLIKSRVLIAITYENPKEKSQCKQRLLVVKVRASWDQSMSKQWKVNDVNCWNNERSCDLAILKDGVKIKGNVINNVSWRQSHPLLDKETLRQKQCRIWIWLFVLLNKETERKHLREICRQKTRWFKKGGKT